MAEWVKVKEGFLRDFLKLAARVLSDWPGQATFSLIGPVGRLWV
jgi:hypothetical protein